MDQPSPKILSPHVFAAIRPEEIGWAPFPAPPPEARLAVLVGDPKTSGPYVIRVRLPGGVKMMPHGGAPRGHTSLSLGQVGRLRHPGLRNRAVIH